MVADFRIMKGVSPLLQRATTPEEEPSCTSRDGDTPPATQETGTMKDKNANSHPELLTALIIASLATASLALSGCNTTEGVGEDISAAGDALDDAAEDAN
jgi:predicted small secreted protein